MRHTGIVLLIFCLSGVFFCLGGCLGRTPDTDYYVLQSGIALGDIDKAYAHLPRVQLRRVDIPAYLNRTPIVTRDQNGVRLTLPNFRAWAEPLESGIQRVLAETLTPPLLAQGVFLQALDDDVPGALQLSVQVYRFDGTLNGQCVLEARWTLRTQSDAVIARGSFAGSENTGADYESLVLAQSALTRRMGEKMAAPIAGAVGAIGTKKGRPQF